MSRRRKKWIRLNIRWLEISWVHLMYIDGYEYIQSQDLNTSPLFYLQNATTNINLHQVPFSRCINRLIQWYSFHIPTKKR